MPFARESQRLRISSFAVRGIDVPELGEEALEELAFGKDFVVGKGRVKGRERRMHLLRYGMRNVPAGEELVGLALAEEGAADYQEEAVAVPALLVGSEPLKEVLLREDAAFGFDVGGKLIERSFGVLVCLARAHRLDGGRFNLADALAGDVPAGADGFEGLAGRARPEARSGA